jgi:hypothetical protein
MAYNETGRRISRSSGVYAGGATNRGQWQGNPAAASEPSQWTVHAHGRQPRSFIEAVLPLPSQPSFGNNQPLDVRPANAAPIQRGGRPVLRPLQVLQPSEVLWPRGFSGSQAALPTAHSLLPAPNPTSFSYPET